MRTTGRLLFAPRLRVNTNQRAQRNWAGTGTCSEGGQPAQRLDVPREPAPADHADAGAGGHGVPAKFFALLDVGNVHLDGGAADALQRVMQGDARVRVGPKIHDEALGAGVGEGMDRVDQRALVVGLEELHRHAELPRLGTDEPLEILQGGRAVDFRLALAKPVQVGAVEDRDLLHGVAREYTRIGADCRGRIRMSFRGDFRQWEHLLRIGD